MEQNNRYGALDGIRAIAAIGIVMMHVLSNGHYGLTGFVFTTVIPSMTDFTYLFMIVSGFSMCCGYYEKFVHKEITPAAFYSRRYRKILPFFALLCLLDFAIDPSLHALMEVFANLTLCFGLLPNASITVIGVGWFLGLVCVFYLLFPFFCYLLSDKRRACVSFAAAVLFSFFCTRYFFNADRVVTDFSPRTNIVFCGMFFLAGGLIYLWREPLARFANRFWYLLLAAIAGGGVCYYLFPLASAYFCLLTGSLILVFAIGIKRRCVLQNAAVAFVSQISLEIYLCHMVAYRVLEKLHFTHLTSLAWVDFLMTFVLTLGGAVLFSLGGKWFLSFLGKKFTAVVNQIRTRKAPPFSVSVSSEDVTDAVNDRNGETHDE